MNIYKNFKTYIQFNNDSFKRSSTIGRPRRKRLLIAFLMVMGFLCSFVNGFSAKAAFQYKPVKAYISFDCKKTDGMEDTTYQISIKSETESSPIPEKDTLTVNSSGKGKFVINISEPGNYKYLLYQIKGSDEKIKYDETKYDVHVNVLSSENGELTYSVFVTFADTDDKPESVEFQNVTVGSEVSTEAPPAKIDTPDDVVPTDTKQAKITTGDEAKIILALILIVFAFAGVITIVKSKKELTKESN